MRGFIPSRNREATNAHDPAGWVGAPPKIGVLKTKKTVLNMTQKDLPKCAHSKCECHVEVAGDYCSTECEASAAGHTKSAHCDCGHAECRKIPKSAKVQIGY